MDFEFVLVVVYVEVMEFEEGFEVKRVYVVFCMYLWVGVSGEWVSGDVYGVWCRRGCCLFGLRG